MIIESLELTNFRNIEEVSVHFSEGTNIFFGDNAQGKTNILEAMSLLSTTKSHRGAKDRDIIRFGNDEAHIRGIVLKNGIDYRLDMHLRAQRTKAVAINGQKIKKASQLLGLLNIIFFSPEDLDIVKGGPSGRRRFLDMELCQLEGNYLYDLNHYNRIIAQRNKLLRDMGGRLGMEETLDLWGEQLLEYAGRIITRRENFVNALNEVIGDLHSRLSGGRESLTLHYEPNVTAEEIKEKLRRHRRIDLAQRVTTVGPHRDDFGFFDGPFPQSEEEETKENELTKVEEKEKRPPLDYRVFGSQGQQRTCALSLKLAEIEIVRKITGENPVLLLDDVLSELDSGRQQYLLDNIGSIQTFITCTGLEELINERFLIDKVFYVENGKVKEHGSAAE